MTPKGLYKQSWRKTPRGMFSTQKNKAAQRGIPWLLAFEEWLNIWGERLPQRGNATGDHLVMARYGDSGPYAANNVRIITKRENDRERIPWHSKHRNPPETLTVNVADDQV